MRNIAEHLPHDKSCGYGCSVVDATSCAHHENLPSLSSEGQWHGVTNNGGEGRASAVGCNANAASAGRSVNANYACSYANANYAGAFAATNRINKGREDLIPRPTRSNTDVIENLAAIGEQGQREYESLPFWGDETAESEAYPATVTPNGIWQELREANSKRNLKGLKKFYCSVEIAEYAVKRCCKNRDTMEKRRYYERSNVVARWMIRQITRGTYGVVGFRRIVLQPHFKTGKQRSVKVYHIYDRCVQMFVLVIIEQKLRRKVLRNNYSNIEGRGIFCNDKTFCMVNQVRTATWKYPNDVVLLTDIKKFYDSVSCEVACGVLFETIKDPMTRRLIMLTFKASGTLPIGSCLSPLTADILMNDYDEIILNEFKPHFFSAFGDNRIFFCDKKTAIRIQQFTKSYYPGRYGVELKDDYQIRPVSKAFSFCKTRYDNGYTRIRGELKRRAIRVANKPSSYAGYNGMMMKTDSKHLLYLIKNKKHKMDNSYGMAMKPFIGTSMPFDFFADKKICITNYRKVDNHKESGYYYLFQIVCREDGGAKLYNTHNGSFEIKAAGDLWTKQNLKPPIYDVIRKDGKGFYFEGYHTSNRDACDVLMRNYEIDINRL